jgi:hypothetical protein
MQRLNLIGEETEMLRILDNDVSFKSQYDGINDSMLSMKNDSHLNIEIKEFNIDDY